MCGEQSAVVYRIKRYWYHVPDTRHAWHHTLLVAPRNCTVNKTLPWWRRRVLHEYKFECVLYIYEYKYIRISNLRSAVSASYYCCTSSIPTSSTSYFEHEYVRTYCRSHTGTWYVPGIQQERPSILVSYEQLFRPTTHVLPTLIEWTRGRPDVPGTGRGTPRGRRRQR